MKGIIEVGITGAFNGDARSLDYSSYGWVTVTWVPGVIPNYKKFEGRTSPLATHMVIPLNRGTPV